MKAVDYLREKGRMTNNCETSCYNCILGSNSNKVSIGYKTHISCGAFEGCFPEKAVELIKTWAIENPEKFE